ncbi:MAG TPA: hypothetical protein VJ951_06385, partial [Bacteroidales bacterium]|nr:hypothetical protein [Bacteroidales bacterium]
GQSCVSGADSAMLYDSLAEKGNEKSYSKFEGRITSLGNIAEAGAALVGGALSTISLRTPYFGQIFIAALALPAAITLVEPVRHIKLINKDLREIIDISRFAIFGSRELRRNILFSAFTGCATLIMAWFAQPYFKYHEIDIKWYGLLWAALNITVAIGSFSAHKLESFLDQKVSIIMIALLIPLGYLSLSFLGLTGGIIVIFIFYLVRGYATPVLKDYINRVTGSDIRATVLSVRNFIIRINFSLLGPFLGYVKDDYDLPTALMYGGTIFIILNTITGLMFLALKGDMRKKTTYISRHRPS